MLAGLYVWSADGFSKAVEENTTSQLLVADSFLVEDGQAIALAQHLARFQASCHIQAAHSMPEIPCFWAQMQHLIPTVGRWFPRVEMRLTAGLLQFSVRLRPAPAASTTIKLVLSTEPDPRHYPQIKGPDLAALETWRQAAFAQGGNEAILCSPTGIVLEGLTTSLVWWEGETLCFPSAHLPTLPSITRHVVGAVAQELNIPIAYRHLAQEHLHIVPVWALNALHGIRPVVQLVGRHHAMPQHPDLALWQRHYRQRRQTL